MELEVKNQTIQKLENEILFLKVGNPETLIKKINAQKSTIAGSQKYPDLVDFKTDFDYANSIQVPLETEVKTKEDVMRLKETSSKLKSILAKFNKERQNLSITAEKVQYDDLSTQTDFTPRISKNLFQKFNKIRLEFPEPEIHFTKLQEKYEVAKSTHSGTIQASNKKIDKFLVDLKSVAMSKTNLVKIETQNVPDWDTTLLEQYREIKFLSRESVLSCFRKVFNLMFYILRRCICLKWFQFGWLKSKKFLPLWLSR